MKTAGGFLVVLCAVLCSAISTTAQLAATCSPGCYGPGLAADALANTVVGGPYANVVSFRFRAGHSGALARIHVYLLPDRVGYSAGTGGKIRITVNTDDGTSAHNPSSTILASYLLNDPLAATPSRYFPVLAFPSPPALVVGQLYHIVFTNVDASPATNYLSVDALYQRFPKTPLQPTLSDTESAELLRSGGGAWAPRKGYTPILQLDYQDAWTEGIGYMEAWVGAPQAISGTKSVRETFTVGGAQKNVKSVAIWVARILGTDPLVVRLEDADGTLIEQGEIPAASFPLTNPLSYSWAQFTFSSAHLLLPGQTYQMVLQSAPSSTYQAFPIRKGLNYGFQNTTYFPDGYAQFKQGSSWVGWTQWGVTNRTDADLSFYFELAAVDSDQSPTISNVAVEAITSSSVTITWVTDQASTSQGEYGTTTAYGSLTTLDSDFVTTHSLPLTGLTAGTLYHYQVRSADASGTLASSGDFTFTTTSSVTPSSVTPIKDITFEKRNLTDLVTGADKVTGTVVVETSAPLKGAASAKVPNASSSYLEESFSGVDDLYISFYLRILSAPSGSPRFLLISNSGTSVGNLVLTSSGRLRLRNASTAIGADSIPLAVGQLYRVGIHQKRGTGSNGVLEAFVALGDAAFGAPFAKTTTGAWTTQGNRLRLGSTTSTAVDLVVDDVRPTMGAMPPPSP